MPIAEEDDENGNICDCVGLLSAVTGSDIYPDADPARIAWLKIGVVEADADPSWLGGILRL